MVAIIYMALERVAIGDHIQLGAPSLADPQRPSRAVITWPERIICGLAVENSPNGRQTGLPESKIRSPCRSAR
jgi:hypothetical protein